MGHAGTVTIGFAHRGGRSEHPDNTLVGFARALQLGADGLESDAWVTADGVAVLDHDGVVGRLPRRRPIAAQRRRDLPGHIPSMAELCALPGADRAQISIDIKDPAAAGAVVAAPGADPGRLWLCGADLATVVAWRSLDDRVHLVHSSGLDRLGGDPLRHPARLADMGVDALNLRASQWSAALVEACHRCGVAAFGWDAQTPTVIADLMTLGIDAVYCDHVAMMVATLADGAPGPSAGSV